MKPNIQLRVLMTKYNQTQLDIANLLQISKASVNIKLNGKSEFKQSELIKLSDFFNVTVDELVR